MRSLVFALALASFCAQLPAAKQALRYQQFVDRCKTCASLRDEASTNPYQLEEQRQLARYEAIVAACPRP